MNRFLSIAVLAASTLLLGACYESTDVTLYEPTVYKGGNDGQTLPDGERQEILRKRFELVQLDR